MSKKQMLAAAVGIGMAAVLFACLYGYLSRSKTEVERTEEPKQQTNFVLPNESSSGPVSVDGVVDGLMDEASLDLELFQKEVAQSALDEESQALNDITQSYDENEF
jgi:hypothetical protein